MALGPLNEKDKMSNPTNGAPRIHIGMSAFIVCSPVKRDIKANLSALLLSQRPPVCVVGVGPPLMKTTLEANPQRAGRRPSLGLESL